MHACISSYINAGQYNCATCQCTNASRCCPFVRKGVCMFVSNVYSRIQSSISYILKDDRRIIVIRISFFHAFWEEDCWTALIIMTKEKMSIVFIRISSSCTRFHNNNTSVKLCDYLLKCKKKRTALFVTLRWDVY